MYYMNFIETLLILTSLINGTGTSTAGQPAPMLLKETSQQDTLIRQYENKHYLPFFTLYKQACIQQVDDEIFVIEVLHDSDGVSSEKLVIHDPERIEQLKNSILYIERNYEEETAKIMIKNEIEMLKLEPKPTDKAADQTIPTMFWYNFGFGSGSLDLGSMTALSWQSDIMVVSLMATFGSDFDIFGAADSKICFGLLGGISSKQKNSSNYFSLTGGPAYSIMSRYSHGGLFSPAVHDKHSSFGIFATINYYGINRLGNGYGVSISVDFNTFLRSVGMFFCWELGSLRKQ